MSVNPNGIVKGFNILKYKPIGMFKDAGYFIGGFGTKRKGFFFKIIAKIGDLTK